MSKPVSAAIVRCFFASAEAVLASPALYTAEAADVSRDLLDAVADNDNIGVKAAVLEMDRLSRARAWSL